MNIIEESFKEKEEKPKRTKRLILVVIVILILAICIVTGVLLSIQEKPMTAIVNAGQNNEIVKIVKFREDGIYIPIKKMASYVGYEAYNGEYKDKSEEANKCYIISENEVVNLKLNEKRIYTLNLSQNNEDYKYYDMKKEVKAIDGELYISSEDMERVFCTSFNYNKEKNQISLLTLTYLAEQYSTKVLDYGYEELDKGFENRKTIFQDMLVVTRNKQTGVIKASTGDIVIEPKYDSIEYLPNIGDFIVSSNNKYGVVTVNKETRVQVVYDSINLIDKEAGIYVVKRDNRYGVIDLKGNSVISVEYDEVGMDINKFEENNIKNKYLLVNNLIPVRKNKLWGMFDKKGKLVVDFIYDSFGYTASSSKNAISLLVVPDYNVVVACKEKKYALINQLGNPLFAPVVDDIYMTYENGRYNYLMNYNDQIMDVEEYIKQTESIKTLNEANTENKANQTNDVQRSQETEQKQQQSQEQSQEQEQQQSQEQFQEQEQQQYQQQTGEEY